jgi:hypothetical protein
MGPSVLTARSCWTLVFLPRRSRSHTTITTTMVTTATAAAMDAATQAVSSSPTEDALSSGWVVVIVAMAVAGTRRGAAGAVLVVVVAATHSASEEAHPSAVQLIDVALGDPYWYPSAHLDQRTKAGVERGSPSHEYARKHTQGHTNPQAYIHPLTNAHTHVHMSACTHRHTHTHSSRLRAQVGGSRD